jgi:hypothetical protein
VGSPTSWLARASARWLARWLADSLARLPVVGLLARLLVGTRVLAAWLVCWLAGGARGMAKSNNTCLDRACLWQVSRLRWGSTERRRRRTCVLGCAARVAASMLAGAALFSHARLACKLARVSVKRPQTRRVGQSLGSLLCDFPASWLTGLLCFWPASLVARLAGLLAKPRPRVPACSLARLLT